MKVADHYDAVADDYHRQYQRENLETEASYPANYFRLQILTRRLVETGCQSVFEVGVGEGTPLVTMAKAGLEVAGCDIAEAMVERARARFAEAGLDPARITWGDLTDSLTLAPHLKDGPFDAVMAAGVLPHVASDELALANMGMMIRDGGRMFLEFRNKLFSMFTFNRLTADFILDDLLVGVDAGVKDAVAAAIRPRLAMDMPPVRDRVGDKDAPGYDAILSRFHNPFELLETVEKAGFEEARVHWYHYHPAPPMLEGELGRAFRKAAIALEHEGSWRGWFLCSAGVIEAVKA